MTKVNRNVGIAFIVRIKFKEKELARLDKLRKKMDRSNYIRAKSLA